MLPSHSTAGELLNDVTNHTECIDNEYCDTSDDDDDVDNNFRRSDCRSDQNAAVSLMKAAATSTITGPPIVDSLAARRPPALNLKPIITNSLNDQDCSLNLSFSDGNDTSEIDGRTRNDRYKRITIAFDNIKYTCQRRLFWRRGEFSLKHFFFCNTKIGFEFSENSMNHPNEV